MKLKIRNREFEVYSYDANYSFILHLTKQELEDCFDFYFYGKTVGNEYLICECEIRDRNRFRFVNVCEQNMDSVFEYNDLPEVYDFEEITR